MNISAKNANIESIFNIIGGWTTQFELNGKLVGGNASILTKDPRLIWHLKTIGGCEGKRILELGALEGAHTKMMIEGGAREVIAIEGLSDCWLRCLIVKEAFNLDRAKFIFCDFNDYVANYKGEKFDFVSAAGVLYHQENPAKLINDLSKITDAVIVWSQVAGESSPSNKESTVEFDGKIYRGKINNYQGTRLTSESYCGGLNDEAFWMYPQEMIRCFKDAGFVNIINESSASTPHGDCLLFTASKDIMKHSEETGVKIILSKKSSSLPISVIVSVKPNRKRFFENYCLPMIINNNPKEIIINESEGGAAIKWNESFRATTQPYVFLCSDDFIIPKEHLEKFLNTLKDSPKNIGYAYPSSYYCFPLEVNNHSEGKNFKFNSREFNGDYLKRGNFIDGSCLWKRENWVDFDIGLKRFLDWDIALRNYIENGISGVIVPDSEFITINLDEGISAKNNSPDEAKMVILNKYNLPIKTILFYPDNLNINCRVKWLCDELNIAYHNNPKEHYDIIFYWSYTQTICNHDEFMQNASSVINKGCCDITKSRVERIFESGISVNPETFIGECVKKSESQGAHDGVMANCQREKEDGYIYQKYINTKNINGNYVDYRIFFSGQIDFIVKKEKSDMFKTELIDIELLESNELLTDSQIKYIEEKCKLFGMDFGELDILIDEQKEIYVIDVNNIAGIGFLNHKNASEIKKRYKESFIRFIQKS